ncbi:hypothetical protein [Salinimonas lutimaris]|uniref:hypothetical protein n=1 Tax=Salinimonas lutimaris TaxID=914153 RepID=UPI001E3D1636|nr:hypothetical protein [Salinimonas lutimaris]
MEMLLNSTARGADPASLAALYQGIAMQSSSLHEYMCPQCGYINAIAGSEICNMYLAQYANCYSCDTKLEIVPADGMNEMINLVISEADEEALFR